ncbi:MAG TPA: glyceraldehyde 3-phosphate dehydrogenase NAD-binding domain-containing protein, partial [Sphingobacteriaceae bacterium]|nr:glyceraldehyde 3-phosphate dehydrogenase NAD-binding domain-containing protein [Sphingobacteriaceae bacterium]
MIQIAINGFGRIGRHTFRTILSRNLKDIQVIAINDLTDTRTLAHLMKYDSVHGPYPGKISFTKNELIVDGVSVRV